MRLRLRGRGAGAMNNLMSGVVPMAAGDIARLPCDFGDIQELVDGAALDSNNNLVMTVNILTFNVTCSGVSITGKQKDFPYQISALFSAPTPGTYNAVYTITLNNADGTTKVRTGQIVVT